MSFFNTIHPEKLIRLTGVPHGPAIIDIRSDEEFAAEPRLLPGSRRRPAETVAEWGAEFAGKATIVVNRAGEGCGEGVAAWLRQAGAASAEVLAGGYAGWRAAGLPSVPEAALPRRDARGRTVWVTRARPKVDRIACPWLIRRFVDPAAVFLYVAARDVRAVAERFGAAPFDIDGEDVAFSHRGDLCTFDAMASAFGLAEFAPLRRVAAIVRGADTGRPDLAPEAAGLLAVSLGLSRMFDDDLAQLEAGVSIYDALFRWARDAVDEPHDMRSHRPTHRDPAPRRPKP